MTANYKDLIMLVIDCMFIDLAGAGKRIARFLKNHNSDYEHTKESEMFYISNILQRGQYDKIDDLTPHVESLLLYVDEIYSKGGTQ